MREIKVVLLFIGCWIFAALNLNAFAQDVSIKLGPGEIALNQPFTITISVENGKLESYDDFPEIAGFVKRGTSSSSSTNYINGQFSSSQSIIQNYIATKEGTFTLKPFSIEINGETYRSQGKTIKVGPPIQRRQQYDPYSNDVFDDFFNRGRRDEPKEFIDLKDDAFFAITTDKDEVFLGEGLNMTIAFYVSEENQAPLEFHDLGKQLTEILKKVKPANCWEENFNIERITGDPIVINNKNYTRYTIFKATYYPLKLENIEIPSAGLEMIKYKVAKKRSFFGKNQQEGFKTFYSKAKEVKVKDLPPHPLKNQVAVGNYRLRESLNRSQLQTGQSFQYSFIIKGEGNLSAINPPLIHNDGQLEVYDPNVQQDIRRAHGTVRGTKSYNYFGIPQNPGKYNLGDYFSWVYFNPDTEAYDTLRAEASFMVTGESRVNESIDSKDLGAFYDRIDLEDQTYQRYDKEDFMKLFANIFILIMLAFTAFFLFKK